MYANNNLHVPMEDSCRICGFLNPDFEGYDDLYSNYCPREFRGISEDSGRSHLNTFYPVQRQDEVERYANYSRFSWYSNIEAVSPDWLREELKRLFPEVRDPAPPFFFSDPGEYIAGVVGNSF
jgi:hypothetical protein